LSIVSVKRPGAVPEVSVPPDDVVSAGGSVLTGELAGFFTQELKSENNGRKEKMMAGKYNLIEDIIIKLWFYGMPFYKFLGKNNVKTLTDNFLDVAREEYFRIVKFLTKFIYGEYL